MTRTLSPFLNFILLIIIVLHEDELKNADGAVLFEPNDEGLGLQDEVLRVDGNGRTYLKIDARKIV